MPAQGLLTTRRQVGLDEGDGGAGRFGGAAAIADAVAADVVELAGGAGALVTRARRYLDRGEPLEALHLLDFALRAEPADRDALAARIAAHEQLLEAAGGENFSEVMWLRSEIAADEDRLE